MRRCVSGNAASHSDTADADSISRSFAHNGFAGATQKIFTAKRDRKCCPPIAPSICPWCGETNTHRQIWPHFQSPPCAARHTSAHGGVRMSACVDIARRSEESASPLLFRLRPFLSLESQKSLPLQQPCCPAMMSRRPRCGANAGIATKYVGHQFAEAVEHRRLLMKIGRAIHQSQSFHNPLHAIQAAQRAAKRRQNRQAGLPCRRFAGLRIQIGARRGP